MGMVLTAPPPAQVNPHRAGTSRFRDAFIPRLPVKVLSAGTLDALYDDQNLL